MKNNVNLLNFPTRGTAAFMQMRVASIKVAFYRKISFQIGKMRQDNQEREKLIFFNIIMAIVSVNNFSAFKIFKYEFEKLV